MQVERSPPLHPDPVTVRSVLRVELTELYTLALETSHVTGKRVNPRVRVWCVCSLSLSLNGSGDNNPCTPPLVRPCAPSHIGGVTRLSCFTLFRTRARTPTRQYNMLTTHPSSEDDDRASGSSSKDDNVLGHHDAANRGCR